jgi:hypothetical protein
VPIVRHLGVAATCTAGLLLVLVPAPTAWAGPPGPDAAGSRGSRAATASAADAFDGVQVVLVASAAGALAVLVTLALSWLLEAWYQRLGTPASGARRPSAWPTAAQVSGPERPSGSTARPALRAVG